MKKGVDEVAIGTVDFHPVKTRCLRSLGSLAVVGHNPWDLVGVESPGDFVWLLPSRSVDVILVDLDWRGSNSGGLPLWKLL